MRSICEHHLKPYYHISGFSVKRKFPQDQSMSKVKKLYKAPVNLQTGEISYKREAYQTVFSLKTSL